MDTYLCFCLQSVLFDILSKVNFHSCSSTVCVATSSLVHRLLGFKLSVHENCAGLSFFFANSISGFHLFYFYLFILFFFDGGGGTSVIERQRCTCKLSKFLIV